MKTKQRLCTTIANCTLILGSASTIQAATLTGSGDHLPLPSLPLNSPVGAAGPTITTVAGGFTGTWDSSAASAWQGTFNATGDFPVSGSTSNTVYDFTTLSSSVLPSGSIFVLSDVDDGSNATVSFQAFDANGALLSNWLDEPGAIFGSGTGAGGAVEINNLPGWEWDAGTSTYVFDGGTTGGNPTVGVYLYSNQAISSVNAVKSFSSGNFAIVAPASVPEPSSALLLGLGGLGMVFRRKRVS